VSGAGRVAELGRRLADAEGAEREPRAQVVALQADLAAAVEARDFIRADALKDELLEARAVLGECEATTMALRTAAAAVERERVDADRLVQEGRQRVQAHSLLESAAAADHQALGSIDAALGEMRGHLAAAQASYRAALAAQDAGLQARHQVLQARVALGEVPAPGGVVIGPNTATVLADNDPLVRELARWKR
jgi:hypothetical protein